MLNKENRNRLKQLARASIEFGIKHRQPIDVDLEHITSELSVIRATFVTLEKQHQLRGCIGTLEARRPLALDVAENSFAAAFSDSRFPPVEKAELEDLDIHISILSPAHELTISSESDLIGQLHVGVDGLILEDNIHRATFLPTVWQSLSKPEEFVHHLKIKAGFDAEYWSKDIRAFRYNTESF